MNKLHEKYYTPLEKLHEDENELDYNYKYFCAEFENFANPKRNIEYVYHAVKIDFLKDKVLGSRQYVQHYFHTLAKTLKIDRGDFAKVNNLEGLKGWYEMILEYRKRLGVDKED